MGHRAFAIRSAPGKNDQLLSSRSDSYRLLQRKLVDALDFRTRRVSPRRLSCQTTLTVGSVSPLRGICLSTWCIIRASLAQTRWSAAMSGLEFTEEAARQLESLYLTRDIVAQRSETIRQLALRSGERVLDVGCGPGFFVKVSLTLLVVTALSQASTFRVTSSRYAGDETPRNGFHTLSEMRPTSPARRLVRCRCMHPGRRVHPGRQSCSFRGIPRSKARRPRSVRCHGLGCPRMAFGKSGPHGTGHEILGIALCPSPLAQVTKQSVGRVQVFASTVLPSFQSSI